MENSSKALIMAGSTLIAVMVLALFVFFMSKISIWPETQDNILAVEQVEKFNAEYEVYQKSAMYGVDVISCLNKAENNNKLFDDGEVADIDGISKVDVEITLKTALTETISMTAYKDGKEKELFASNGIVDSAELGRRFATIGEIFEDDCGSFNPNDIIYYGMELSSDKIVQGTYRLLDDEDYLELKLLKDSVSPKKFKRNPNKNLEYVEGGKHGWMTATLNTYLYNLKTLRFKCTGIEYNKRTGVVSLIKFEEI